jgi:hypothetical protein
MSLFHNISPARFLEREGDPETKKPNKFFPYYLPLYWRFIIFMPKSTKVLSKREFFSSKLVRMCVKKSKILCCFHIWGNISEKKCTGKIRPSKLFFWGFGLVPNRKSRCTASPIWPVKCTIVLNVLYKGSWCTVHLCISALCGIIRSRDVPLLHPSHYRFRFSPLAALERDGPGWFTPRKFVSSQTCDEQMPNNVCK